MYRRDPFVLRGMRRRVSNITSSGYYSREFARRTDGGMVGINVGIPVPVGIFPFSGHKDSFFGDLHVLGKDGVRFFTEVKACLLYTSSG